MEESDIDALKSLKNLKSINGFLVLDNERKTLETEIKELPNLRIQRDSLDSTLTQGNQAIIREYEDKCDALEKLKKDAQEIKVEVSRIERDIQW